MREDMAKVIVERPRYYRQEKVNKLVGRQARHMFSEDAPKWQPMKRRWMALKELNEHLQPLRRYLHSQVGKRWDDIYSEICSRISKSSAVQSHLLDHAMQYVARDIIIVDGRPHLSTGKELVYERNSEILFWVHPATGIMHALSVGKKPKCSELPPSRYEQIRISDRSRYVRVRSIWWEVQFLKVQPSPWGIYSSWAYSDIILDKDPLYKQNGVSYQDLMREWQEPVVAVSRRQLNSREIKRMFKEYA